MEFKAGIGNRLVVGGPISLGGGYARMLESFYRKAGVSVSSLSFLKLTQPVTDDSVRTILESRPWERIDAVGEQALSLLTGQKSVMKWRGSPLECRLLGTPVRKVMPILEPEYLIKDASMIPATLSDMGKGMVAPPQYYTTRGTLEDLRAFTSKFVCFDIETVRATGAITMVGLSYKPFHVLVVPFQGAYIHELKRIFANADEVVGQNIIGFDLVRLAENDIGIRPDCLIWDIMLMHHLVQPDAPHDLEYIVSITSNIIAWKHLAKQNMEWYCATDVDGTLQAFHALKMEVMRHRLMDLYMYVQVPLAKICKQMSETGIARDPNRIKTKRVELLKELEVYEAQLPSELRPFDKATKKRVPAPKGTVGKSGKPLKYVHVPSTERVVPWQSPKLVAKYFYETLSLPIQKQKKTGKMATDKQAVDKLFKLAKPEHKAGINAVKSCRGLDELLGSFLKEEVPGEIAVTRIHSNFLVHGTNTGRLSSSEPNMQNVPAVARFVYVPSFDDWCFVEADFSSLENRLAAWYAGDTDRLNRLSDPSFNEHRWLASQIFGVPENEIDKKSREYKLGKITNHGADGSMGPRTLAKTYDIDEKLAKDLILKWRTINHRSANWQEQTGNEAVSKGQLTNAFGRKRWFWSKSGYTEGIRFLPQSSGADICFRAMIALMYERINWSVEDALKVSSVCIPMPQPVRLVLQVHDSLLFECPYHMVDEVKRILALVLTQTWKELGAYSIPIDIKTGQPGQSWGELK